MTPIAAEAQIAAIERTGHRHTTAIALTRIVWRVWGAGPPIVLVHGGAGSWTYWVHNILPLAQRFHVIVPDLPGYGESDALPGPITPKRLARVLADGLGALPGAHRTYRLAGFSFGSIVAEHLAAIEGARVERLALLGAGGLGLPRLPNLKLQRPRPDMEPAEVLAVHRHNLAILMFGDSGRVDDLAVHVQRENVRHARVRAGGFPASASLSGVLPRIGARLSGNWGERDAFAAPYLAERVALLHRVQPGSDVRIIPGAGHWAPYETADEVNKMLMEMLGDAPSSGDPEPGPRDGPRIG